MIKMSKNFNKSYYDEHNDNLRVKYFEEQRIDHKVYIGIDGTVLVVLKPDQVEDVIDDLKRFLHIHTIPKPAFNPEFHQPEQGFYGILPRMGKSQKLKMDEYQKLKEENRELSKRVDFLKAKLQSTEMIRDKYKEECGIVAKARDEWIGIARAQRKFAMNLEHGYQDLKDKVDEILKSAKD